MTVIDNEETKICKESEDATQIANTTTPSTKKQESLDSDTSNTVNEDNKSNHKKAKTIGGIAVGGVLLGTAASVFTDMKGAQPAELHEMDDELDETDTLEEGIVLPEITVEAISLRQENPAKDWMTFEEAFSAAREALGTGSAFEWHGKVYATYTHEEWADMSDDQKSDFYDTLHIPNPFTSDGKEEVPIEDAVLTAQSVYTNTPGANLEESITAQTAVLSEDDSFGEDIPVISVGNSRDDENDIQILGINQDIATGYNVGHLSVDGEEVVVIDVDGDMIFDSMVADLNHDGEITPDEIIDISQQSLSLDNLSGHPDFLGGPLSATGDSPDYLSEIVE